MSRKKRSYEIPFFPHRYAVEIAEVSDKALTQWTQRGIIDLGEVTKGGRRLYSLLDVVELTLIGELVNFLGMPIAHAAAAMAKARKRIAARLVADEENKPLCMRVSPEEREYMVLWMLGGEPRVAFEQGTDWLANNPYRFPFSVVPFDEIIESAWNDSVLVAYRNGRILPSQCRET